MKRPTRLRRRQAEFGQGTADLHRTEWLDEHAQGNIGANEKDKQRGFRLALDTIGVPNVRKNDLAQPRG